MRNHEQLQMEAALIVEEHHERYDGKGYPYGPIEEEISLESSNVSVVDALWRHDTNRVYRSGMSVQEAIQEIRDGLGVEFHPEVLDEFLQMLHKK